MDERDTFERDALSKFIDYQINKHDFVTIFHFNKMLKKHKCPNFMTPGLLSGLGAQGGLKRKTLGMGKKKSTMKSTFSANFTPIMSN